MQYELIRNTSAPARKAMESLPLRNLPIAKLVNGKLEGDALFIKGKKTQEVSSEIYKKAAEMDVKVALRFDAEKNGVKVFRLKKTS